MFILIGEQEGDYDDFYQRNREALAVAEDKETLLEYWESLPARAGNTFDPKSGLVFLRTVDEMDYVDFEIVKVPFLDRGFEVKKED